MEAVSASGVLSVISDSGTTFSVVLARGTGSVVRTFTSNGTAQAVTLIASDLNTLGNGSVNVTVTASDMAGNTRIGNTSFVLDTLPPVPTVTPISLLSSGSLAVQSNEAGVAYLVDSTLSVLGQLGNITNAADARWNTVAIPTANANTLLPLSGLSTGDYTLYLFDSAGNLTVSNALVRVVSAPTVTLSVIDSSGSVVTNNRQLGVW